MPHRPWGRSRVAASSRAEQLIVICATSFHDDVKSINHHMAEQLSKPYTVLYVEPPTSRFATRVNPAIERSLAEPRLREVSAGYWVLTPVVMPFPMRTGARPITEQVVRHKIAGAVARIGLPTRAVLSGWPEIDPFGACGEQLSIWWAQDDYAAATALSGGRVSRLSREVRARVTTSDLVVAISAELADRWRSSARDLVLIPNGTDPGAFAEVGSVTPAPDVHFDGPVAVLIGQLNDRIDGRFLHAVADRSVSLLLVGPDFGAKWLPGLVRRPEVVWVRKQPFEFLPGYLAHAHVGLVPYADIAFNRSCFPLKLLEYLAAGLPVVSTDLPAARWLTDDTTMIQVAASPERFADAVVGVCGPSSTADRAARRAFAEQHSYGHRASELLSAIDERIAAQHARPTGRRRQKSGGRDVVRS